MSWEETLYQYGALIEEKLKGFFEETINAAGVYHPFIGKVYSNIGEFVLRKGKRLASCSTLLTYKGYTGNVNDQILRACVGIELYRHCILAHDDLIDRDALRRGGKTLHRLFAEGRDRRLGEGVAVFTGDILYAQALQCLMTADFPQEKLGRAACLLSEGYRTVNESQILDLLFEYKETDVDEWYRMASRRAASLFKVTFLTGAILGNAPEKDLQTLGEAAVHVGYSFDIKDDIIDTFASREQYGRPPGGDLARGKKPLHIVYTLKLADRRQLEKLKGMISKKRVSQESLERIRAIIRECGALEAAKEESRKHAERAKALIAQTNLSGETKGFFASFISYIEESLDWYV